MQRPSPLALTILAHLAAMACVPPAREPAPPESAAPVAVTQATPVTTASAATMSTQQPTAQPTPQPTPQPMKRPTPTTTSKFCNATTPCGPKLYCQRGFEGATMSEDGVCVTHPPVYKGRPLMVDGEAHLARVDVVGDVHADLSSLVSAAREEHASIAAFARTTTQLMALGAPLSLLREVQRALVDEIRHTELVVAAAQERGATVTLEELPAAVAPLTPTAWHEASRLELAHALLVDVIRGGVIGEARSARDLSARASNGGPLKALFAKLAADEARHAALALSTAQWIVSVEPSLAFIVEIEREAFIGTATDDDLALVQPLFRALA